MNRGPWMTVTCVFLVIMPFSSGQSASYVSPLRGIAYISVTTDDLESSLRFYTQVLGGMQIRDLSFRFHGDEHYEIMFHKELQEARAQGLDPVQLGVPDIRDSGTHEVRGEFVVFDNGLIQLIEFSARNGPDAGSVFVAYESRTSPAYIAAPHICFWVQDDVDFNHYIAQLEARSAALGLTRVKANRPVEVHSEAERVAVPEDQLGITFQDGNFAGLSYSYFKGPSGEQLELYRLRNESRYYMGREYCQRRAVSTAFIDNYSDNHFKQAAGVPGKLFGLIQFGTRTDDLWRSANFYVNVLDASLVKPPLQAVGIRGDDSENMLFMKEMLDAESQNMGYQDLGVANISNSGNMRLDFRFELFDNYVVETLLYTDGLELGLPLFNPRYNHSSLAYVNDMHVTFMLDDAADLASYLTSLDDLAAANGFRQVQVHRLPNSRQGHVTFTSGALSGMSYGMLNGPAGEHLAIVQFSGPAREKLRRALVEYGAVSTAFPETNPWPSGSMDSFCAQYTAAPVGR